MRFVFESMKYSIIYCTLGRREDMLIMRIWKLQNVEQTQLIKSNYCEIDI